MKIPRRPWSYGVRQIRWMEGGLPAAFDGNGTFFEGLKGEAAVIVAGGIRLAATEDGNLKVGDRAVPLGAPPVPDGVIAAGGRIYVSTTKGTVVCLGGD